MSKIRSKFNQFINEIDSIQKETKSFSVKLASGIKDKLGEAEACCVLEIENNTLEKGSMITRFIYSTATGTRIENLEGFLTFDDDGFFYFDFALSLRAEHYEDHDGIGIWYCVLTRIKIKKNSNGFTIKYSDKTQENITLDNLSATIDSITESILKPVDNLKLEDIYGCTEGELTDFKDGYIKED